MYNTTRLYDLSFVAPQRRPRTKPQIVFSIDTRHFSEISWRLERLAENLSKSACAYFGYETALVLPIPDLFGNVRFGYGACGFVTSVKNETHFHIELSTEQCAHAAYTLHALTTALSVPSENTGITNQPQQIDLQTICDTHRSVYGHATGGYVSAEFVDWIKRQAGGDADKCIHAPVPDIVERAMRTTWVTVKPELRRFAREVRGRVVNDGRFILECFGNACDLAIYPDDMRDTSNDSSLRFSCHNLDTAEQQLTLIAGLAKLCELARSNEQ